jgi:hypothetical protein
MPGADKIYGDLTKLYSKRAALDKQIAEVQNKIVPLTKETAKPNTPNNL